MLINLLYYGKWLSVILYTENRKVLGSYSNFLVEGDAVILFIILFKTEFEAICLNFNSTVTITFIY